MGRALLLTIVLVFADSVSTHGQPPRVHSPIKSDEQVIFFPTAGHLDKDGGHWLLPIHGWIFEPQSELPPHDVMLGLLRRALLLPPDAPETRIFRRRARFFLVDNERGKRIPVDVGGTSHVMSYSGADGHFAGEIRLPAERIDELLRQSAGAARAVACRAVTPPGDQRTFVGRVYLPAPTGISVVSDIDDTVKVSNVRDPEELLRNTFLRDFQAVPGMAKWYRQWQGRGAAFHYVSSSPYQLYVPLAQFLTNESFPEGSVHLKQFRWKDTSFLNLFASPLETKPKAIAPLLKAFPQRQFVLIGDSAEKDPEVYGLLARQFANQVLHIYIRNVTDESADTVRFRRAFEGLPADRWTLFKDPTTLRLPETVKAP